MTCATTPRSSGIPSITGIATLTAADRKATDRSWVFDCSCVFDVETILELQHRRNSSFAKAAKGAIAAEVLPRNWASTLSVISPHYCACSKDCRAELVFPLPTVTEM